MINAFIKKFSIKDYSVIDVNILSQIWDDCFLLSQWRNDFYLIQTVSTESCSVRIKCKVTQQQALEIIKLLYLVKIPSLFTSACSWRKNNINSK